MQSEQAAAAHVVDVAGNGSRVVGMTWTRGGSARSTAEPAARAAVEIAEGRLSARACTHEAAVSDPEAFLGLLDTEVSWDRP